MRGITTRGRRLDRMEEDIDSLYESRWDHLIAIYHRILPGLKRVKEAQEELARRVEELNKKVEALTATGDGNEG